MSWDASDEETWERWELDWRERRARRAAEAGAVERREVVRVAIGETEPAGSHGGERPAPLSHWRFWNQIESASYAKAWSEGKNWSRDPESLNPVYGLYDRLPHEED